MKSLKKILIAVVLVSVLALVYLSYDSTAQLQQRTPPLTAEVVKGKEAWQRHNCINCHTILGNGAYFAPDLTKTAVKRSRDWLTGFLTAPNKVWPGTAMANVSVTAEEARNLTAFLAWVKDIDTNGWPPKPLMPALSGQQSNGNPPSLNNQSKGKEIFDAEGCSGCHQIKGIGGNLGLDLTTVGNSRDKEWLKAFLQNPQQVMPNTPMMAPNISGEALDALVNYLASLK